MPAKNAIALRLDLLHDQWNEFASNPEARILRWLVHADELRMIETFVETEQDDVAGEIPDLFVRFMEPFDDVHSYGALLHSALLQQYDVSRSDLDDEGIDSSWTPPSTEGRHSLIAFLEACASMHKHYAE